MSTSRSRVASNAISFASATASGAFDRDLLGQAEGGRHDLETGDHPVHQAVVQRAGTSISSPVSASSRVTAGGSRSAARLVAPTPTNPRFTSGNPKVAWSAATTRSQPNMMPKPPATAAPFTAAITGFGYDALDEDRGTGTVVGGDAIARCEGLEVHPRAEGPIAGSGEHDHAHGVVVLRARERLADAPVGRRSSAFRCSGRLMVTSRTNPVVTTSTVMGG